MLDIHRETEVHISNKNQASCVWQQFWNKNIYMMWHETGSACSKFEFVLGADWVECKPMLLLPHKPDTTEGQTTAIIVMILAASVVLLLMLPQGRFCFALYYDRPLLFIRECNMCRIPYRYSQSSRWGENNHNTDSYYSLSAHYFIIAVRWYYTSFVYPPLSM